MIALVLVGCMASLAIGLLAEPVAALPQHVDNFLGPPTPRWGLPMLCLDRDITVSWRSREWWQMGFWRFLAGPAFRAAMWLGVWSVSDGERYVSGRLALPWNNTYSRFLRERARFLPFIVRGTRT